MSPRGETIGMLCEACTSRCYEHGTRDVDTRVLLMRRRRASRQLAVGSGVGSWRTARCWWFFGDSANRCQI